MMRTTIVLAGAASLLALAACSKKTETAATGAPADANATAPVSSSASSSAAPSGAFTPPSRKPGLWEQTIALQTMKQTTSICLDETVDQKMKWWGSQAGKGKQDCSEQSVKPHMGGGWEFHAVCKMGESGTVTSDGQATGDFGSHYTVDVTSTTAGSPMAQANGVHKIKIDAVWKGPCPADMRPGDMTLPGGMKMNMIDVMDGKGPAMAGGHMSPAEAAAMRKQAMEMAKSMKEKQ